MNQCNTGETISYEVWGCSHADADNYPDRIFVTTDSIEIASRFIIPGKYEKQIIRIVVKRNFLDIEGQL